MSSPRPANIPVSTTPSLDGWDIDEYLGVATAHVVAGTNVFSDIAGSFSDIFGGHPSGKLLLQQRDLFPSGSGKDQNQNLSPDDREVVPVRIKAQC